MTANHVELPTAGDIMNAQVDSFSPETKIAAAVETLLELGYSGAPVVDGQGRPIGVLSEHDCIRVLTNSLYEGWPTGSVADHMTEAVEAVDVQTDVLALAQRFALGHHRRLLVVVDGKLVGLVSRRDLMRTLAELRRNRDQRRPMSSVQ